MTKKKKKTKKRQCFEGGLQSQHCSVVIDFFFCRSPSRIFLCDEVHRSS